jgi:hypothetical protein
MATNPFTSRGNRAAAREPMVPARATVGLTGNNYTWRRARVLLEPELSSCVVLARFMNPDVLPEAWHGAMPGLMADGSVAGAVEVGCR